MQTNAPYPPHELIPPASADLPDIDRQIEDLKKWHNKALGELERDYQNRITGINYKYHMEMQKLLEGKAAEGTS
jgi:hypothetical protein